MGECAFQNKHDTVCCRDPKEVGWGALGAEYVCKSMGIFLAKETAEAIIDGGAKKVASSSPAKNDSQVVVMGVHVDQYGGSENFVACVSCTTNGPEPMVGRVGFKRLN